MENLWKPKEPLNRRSDIVCKVKFQDIRTGNIIPIPSVPWSIKFYTDDRHFSVTTHEGGKIINGKINGEELICSIASDTLSDGTLFVEKRFAITDKSFPDGTRDYVNVIQTEYELVTKTEEDVFTEPFFAFEIDMFLATEDGVLLVTEDNKPINMNSF